MSAFLKNVIANIVAFFIIIIGVIGFFSLIGLVGSVFDSSEIGIENNSLLSIRLEKSITESETENEASFLEFKQKTNVRYYDLIESIKKASEDSHIKGISLELTGSHLGNTQIDNLRSAFSDFQKKGKFIYAYGNRISQSEYYLASIADKLFLNPVGSIELMGMSTEVLLFKNLFDKYGLGVTVIRHGKFKAAVEPFLLNKISDENRLQTQTLLDDLWNNKFLKMAKSRKLTPQHFKTSVDSLYALIPELALQNKLVDQLIQHTEYTTILKKKLNVSDDKDFHTISINNYASTLKTENQSEKIAVLYATGQILDGQGDSAIYGETFVKMIKEIADNDKIKALVLRVNSPGGSAAASDEILFELENLKNKKPIVVSFGDYAASGGYYISMAANKIYSEPNTITGSIGVFGLIFDVKKIAKEQGITTEIIGTNANSNMFSPVSGIGIQTKSMMQRNVENTYKRFVNFVSKNRKMSYEQVNEIGGGRVWSGSRAKSIGLVDELGSLNDAIAYAKTLAKVGRYSLESYPKATDGFQRFIKNINGSNLSVYFLKKELGESNFELFQKIKNSKANELQMSLPFDIRIK